MCRTVIAHRSINFSQVKGELKLCEAVLFHGDWDFFPDSQLWFSCNSDDEEREARSSSFSLNMCGFFPHSVPCFLYLKRKFTGFLFFFSNQRGIHCLGVTDVAGTLKTAALCLFHGCCVTYEKKNSLSTSKTKAQALFDADGGNKSGPGVLMPRCAPHFVTVMLSA